MSEQHNEYIDGLRSKIQNWLKTTVGKTSKWGKYIQYTPDLFQLLIKLSGENDITAQSKAKLAVAIAYFVSPLDFIPEEFWGALGYVDDIALTAYVLNDILQSNDPQIILKHWQISGDLTDLISDILNDAEEMVGKKWWVKLKELVR
ncbi:MAG: DUF1232 domain-containing protein [Candidatus Marinimicrobia bacterium]|nr:DUF1232 domain-containing protein [Candidatus Neomarinimicrobiota bacterium]